MASVSPGFFLFPFIPPFYFLFFLISTHTYYTYRFFDPCVVVLFAQSSSPSFEFPFFFWEFRFFVAFDRSVFFPQYQGTQRLHAQRNHVMKGG